MLISAKVMATALLLGPFAAAPKREPAPERVLIPAGVFVRGSARGADDERPREQRRLPAFTIDRTEVTRGMYAACVAARRCAKPSGDVSAMKGTLKGSLYPPQGVPPGEARQHNATLTREPELPMTKVNRLEARAYCAFAGGRLPTEGEWEKAARGTDGREFPWGDDADCGRANWGNFDGEGPCAGRNPGRPVTVGGYPSGASPYGVVDLAGNVWEWIADKYDVERTRRIVRGGSCCSYFVEPRAANRNAWDPHHRDGDLGFRCAGKK
jgi:eukaryotic-like serine/threonine-protein kinase